MNVGLLGGSFNPVHNGHLRLAVEALEQGGLDRVELVPAFIPPHKEDRIVQSFAFRSELIEASIAHMPGLVLNTMEGQRKGPSYTVDTLEMYRQMHPRHVPFFLIGCPDFVQLPQWYQWHRLIHLTHFIVVAREEGDEQILDRFIPDTWSESEKKSEGSWLLPHQCRVQLLQTPILEISSSLIRDKMTRGKSIRYLVPEPVWAELGPANKISG